MIIEKGKTVTVMPSNFLDSPNFAGGGYLTFCVSTIKKIIVSTNALNICFLIVTTSLPDCVYGNWWHNRPPGDRTGAPYVLVLPFISLYTIF